MKDTKFELYAVFAADDHFAPMLVLPARDADHALDRARRLRSAFPKLLLGPPTRSRRADRRCDLGWPGIGTMPESIFAALEASDASEASDHEAEPTHRPISFVRRPRGSAR